MRINRLSRGFTLMEALVSASLFAIVVSSILGVFLSVVKIDRKTRAERTIQQNARFIMEFLGKEVRNGRINYPAYGGTIIYNASGGTDTLHIVNQLNEAETIFCTGNGLSLTKTSGTTNLNSNGSLITRCNFFVSPARDPFQPLTSIPAPPNDQPFVTVVLQISSAYGNGANDRAVIDLQTTFAVRDYSSRE